MLIAMLLIIMLIILGLECGLITYFCQDKEYKDKINKLIEEEIERKYENETK